MSEMTPEKIPQFHKWNIFVLVSQFWDSERLRLHEALHHEPDPNTQKAAVYLGMWLGEIPPDAAFSALRSIGTDKLTPFTQHAADELLNLLARRCRTWDELLAIGMDRKAVLDAVGRLIEHRITICKHGVMLS